MYKGNIASVFLNEKKLDFLALSKNFKLLIFAPLPTFSYNFQFPSVT